MAPFKTYDQFFAYYVRQHRHPGNRLLHALGTGLGISVVIAAFALGKWLYALLWIPLAYGCAWAGHFLLERNRPATFGHPLWSLVSDFRMLALMLTGRLEPWLKKSPQADEPKL